MSGLLRSESNVQRLQQLPIYSPDRCPKSLARAAWTYGLKLLQFAQPSQQTWSAKTGFARCICSSGCWKLKCENECHSFHARNGWEAGLPPWSGEFQHSSTWVCGAFLVQQQTKVMLKSRNNGHHIHSSARWQMWLTSLATAARAQGAKLLLISPQTSRSGVLRLHASFRAALPCYSTCLGPRKTCPLDLCQIKGLTKPAVIERQAASIIPDSIGLVTACLMSSTLQPRDFASACMSACLYTGFGPVRR